MDTQSTIVQFLIQPITTYRVIGNWFYVGTFVLLILSFYLLIKRRLVKFGILLYGAGSLMNFIWEMILVFGGARAYQSGFPFVAELLYHSITETGPVLVIMVLLLEKFKVINLEKYND